MILSIKEQFCIQFDTDEELERDEVFYRNHNIKFSRGYMKICVLEQKIQADEKYALELFIMWPEIDITYNYGSLFTLMLDIRPKVY